MCEAGRFAVIAALLLASVAGAIGGATAAPSSDAGATSTAVGTASEGTGAFPAQNGTTRAPGPCEEIDPETPAVVAILPDERRLGPGEMTGLYPGSELTVLLCVPEAADDGSGEGDGGDRDGDGPSGDGENDEGPNWRLAADDADGIEASNASSDRRASVTFRGSDAVDLGALAAPEPIDGPVLYHPGTSAETDLVPSGRIAVPGPEVAADLADAERAFDERRRQLTDRAADVNATAGAARAGEADGTELRGTARTVRREHAEFADAGDRLQGVLYEVAGSQAGGPETGVAVATAQERRAATTREVRDALTAYEAALDERESSAVLAVRLRILGPLLGGLIAGGLLGAAVPTWRGRAARETLARGEWASYPRWPALVPAVVGLVLAGSGLFLLWQRVGPLLAEVVL